MMRTQTTTKTMAAANQTAAHDVASQLVYIKSAYCRKFHFRKCLLTIKAKEYEIAAVPKQTHLLRQN